ncbi:MAG: hypothetical protein ABJB98_06445 [Actinomycetota bacterium]
MTEAAGGGSELGSLGEEAVRLLGAVQDWARRTWPDEHPATGAPECRWCPICQLLAVLRGHRPEVNERLTQAGTAVVTALQALLDASTGPDADQPDRGRVPRVQHIDLDRGD